ncbi:hypothetical protein UlMin_024054 [Ulmus minor]
MAKDTIKMQKDCPNCALKTNNLEVVMITEVDDWRRPYIEYLAHRILPDEKREAFKVKRNAFKYFLKYDLLYWRGFDGDILRCLSNYEIEEVLQEIHQGDCGEHQGGRKLYEEALRLGYYWPTMEKDA